MEKPMEITKEQTARIQQMEQYLDRASAAVMELSAALDKYQEAQEALSELNVYYGSEEWRQDFAADEAGLQVYQQFSLIPLDAMKTHIYNSDIIGP